MKTTIDDEIEEDTRVTDGDEEFLLFYFRRERQVLGNMFGHKYVLKHFQDKTPIQMQIGKVLLCRKIISNISKSIYFL